MSVDKNNAIVLGWGDYTNYKIDLYNFKNSWIVLYTHQGKIVNVEHFENLEDAVKSFSELITITNNKLRKK